MNASPKTPYAQGAADARLSFKHYIKGMRKRFPHHQLMLDVLLAWITVESLQLPFLRPGRRSARNKSVLRKINRSTTHTTT